jgi:hypothetical protein
MKNNKLICALLLGGALLWSLPASANSEVCRAPNGFLDEGIGGTGGKRIVHRGEEDGIGGTGAAITTAYVTGTIYAHGSICVNGLRITYDDKTPVRDGQATLPATSLQLGQVVQVVAHKDSKTGALAAQSVTLLKPVECEIEAINRQKGTLRVMGETVQLNGRIDIDRFHEDQGVSVSGMRNADGVIEASAIADKVEGLPDRVVGLIRKDDQGRAYVGDTPITEQAGQSLPFGTIANVQGHWDGRTMKISRLDHASPYPTVTSSGYFSIEGYIEKINGKDKIIRINGVDATVKSLNFINENETMTIGERVLGMGTITPDGAVRIDSVVDLDAPDTLLLDGSPDIDAPDMQQPQYNR